MSTPNEETNKTLTLPEKLRAWFPWISAGIILIGYGFFICYLIGKIGVGEKEWIQITYIFGSVEAIVFTAVGFIFGREVNRSRAIKAEEGEEKAKKEKRELAKEILVKLPTAPATPRSMNAPSNDLEGLRTMANIYLHD